MKLILTDLTSTKSEIVTIDTLQKYPILEEKARTICATLKNFGSILVGNYLIKFEEVH